ncbi:hypothetical protein NPIL_612451 [Nephila pilipes]|uniref:BLTX750 n=1 Tax=Nephila pilipes TaxID=299642 RepID=A0A076KVK6_NEPPI|nr:BLTX750 [Nephila pilipes]GFT42047.1 hypothetical protein NPIL_612451 [Nephila pilipes]
MHKDSEMCKTKMYTDELLEMILSVSDKQMKSRGNLRMEVLLKTTQDVLQKELKEKQQIRKRKWEALKSGMNKRSRIDTDVEMVDDELIGLNDFFSSLKSVTLSSNGNV